MEVLYSSVPESKDSLKSIVIFSGTVLFFALLIWYLNKKIKKEDENRNIHEG
jgi:predicted permease